MVHFTRMQRLSLFVVLSVVVVSVGFAADQSGPAKSLLGLPLVFHEDFETGRADRWQPSSDKAWKIVRQGENHVYSQHKHVKIETPVRSPFNRALVKDLFVGDFVLDVQLQSTIKDYGHRDLCLFFGFQDPAHLYYVHLGKKMDDHANNIFIVNDKPRTKISRTTTAGTDWDDEWHHARVVRNVETGTIEVYFDDMKKPVMTAVDKTFSWGQVGVGSFDDTGNFDEILVYGEEVEPSKK